MQSMIFFNCHYFVAKMNKRSESKMGSKILVLIIKFDSNCKSKLRDFYYLQISAKPYNFRPKPPLRTSSFASLGPFH